jgi:hypothetical protein
MPRHLNLKCQSCSLLSTEEAIILHGASGDGCWNGKTCSRRRHYYRNRHLRGKKPVDVEEFDLSEQLPNGYVGYFITWRATKDSPVHALSGELWTASGQPIARIKPMHCGGLVGTQIKEMAKLIRQQFASTVDVPLHEIRMDYEKYLPLHTCPIRPCILAGDTSDR